MSSVPLAMHLKRAESYQTLGLTIPKKSFWEATLASALFRCYHYILFFTAWATCVTLINVNDVFPLRFQSTLLTVIGTVIGFVISYWTTSTLERYNEGRQMWSQMILHSRTLARTVWFHIPDKRKGIDDKWKEVPDLDDGARPEVLVEKKTVINLIEAFGVSVKHYLRGEGGIDYNDLWPLVKFLPAYALPTALDGPSDTVKYEEKGHICERDDTKKAPIIPLYHGPSVSSPTEPTTPSSPTEPRQIKVEDLKPSHQSPGISIFDHFPFSLCTGRHAKQGKIHGHKTVKARAKLGKDPEVHDATSDHIPLEIIFYLSSYIASLQQPKVVDDPTLALLYSSLNGLVEALTGMERFLTTPMPSSYHMHLRIVTIIYCLAMPLQIWQTMEWLTIPAAAISTFIFFGFLVAGEGVENPFDYDADNLDMDHFTHSIIRPELIAITSKPTPKPSVWALSPYNDLVFDTRNLVKKENSREKLEIQQQCTPDKWINERSKDIRTVLKEGASEAIRKKA